MKKTIEERFWGLVSKDCWLWLGSIKPRNGYGHFVDGAKNYNAHRLAYELAYGPIEAGMEVMHTCDVPACVNPAHLKLGTHADNMADCKRKRRHAHGERSFHARLTEDLVIELRRRARAGIKYLELAAEFGQPLGRITCAINGRSWRHITVEPPFRKKPGRRA